MKFRVAIVVLEKLDSSTRAIKVINIRGYGNESLFVGKGQKHSKTSFCELEF